MLKCFDWFTGGGILRPPPGDTTRPLEEHKIWRSIATKGARL